MSLKGPKKASKRHQNDPTMMLKRSLRDPKVTPDPKNGPKSPQNHSKMVPFWSQKWPEIWSKWLKGGQKGAQTGTKTVQKSSRPSKLLTNSQNPLTILPDTHLLHIFRCWNVDFDRFVKQNKCFIAEKGCFSHNFAYFVEFWQKFAHFCFLLHHFA